MSDGIVSLATEIDVTQPSVARVYDYWLGGKDNFAGDRMLAEEVIRRFPQIRAVVRENRAFLQRVVRYLVDDCGIRQFIDIGTGLPTQENVHQVAQRCNPAVRVVYVDNDPIVLTHAEALLATNGHTTVIEGDVREPAIILDRAMGSGLIDLAEPAAVLMIALLHFVTDEDDPQGIVNTFADAVAPGSYLAISHAQWRADAADAAQLYDRASAPMVLRHAAAIERLFGRFDVVSPGVVNIPAWRPCRASTTGDQTALPAVGGVGRLG
ncbi:SAM-dependent methyltransferase [Actinoallomurus sp. CA-150999]|uniref:SAM-dependent methyltransferase n=1 Tax=Actinoallomurus sp. CA-150999 TaxID=3239887 RepID=UPI003D9283D9